MSLISGALGSQGVVVVGRGPRVGSSRWNCPFLGPVVRPLVPRWAASRRSRPTLWAGVRVVEVGTHLHWRAVATIYGGRMGRPVAVRTAIAASNHVVGRIGVAEVGWGVVCGDVVVAMIETVSGRCCPGSGVFFAAGGERWFHLTSARLAADRAWVGPAAGVRDRPGVVGWVAA